MKMFTRPILFILGLAVLAGCGKSPEARLRASAHRNISAGIVGGVRVPPGSRLLKQVALLEKRCTVTFIEPHIVMTAAHCFPDRNATTGTIRFTDDGSTSTFETTFQHIAIHPGFDPYMGTSAHDIALIYTEDELPEGFVITPLAQRMTKPKTSATAAGRGLTYYPEQLGPHTAHDLLLRTVDLNGLRLVKSGVGVWYNLKIDEKAGVSSGDSGGPLFAEEDGVMKQIAIASTIKDSQSGGDVAYTSVVQNADWIKTASAELTARAAQK